MPYIKNMLSDDLVTFAYPVDWVDAKLVVGGANAEAIDGTMATQKIINTTSVYKPMTLKLSWINHSQYLKLYDYYNSVSIYTLEFGVSGSGPIYTVAFQSGADAFDFTPIVPEVPYSNRGATVSTIANSFYDGTIKLVCINISGG
jgi:hypothetical protein